MISKIDGESNLPKTIPMIIVANHESKFDHLLILYPVIKMLNRKIYFLAIPRWWYSIKFIRKGLSEIILVTNPKKAFNDAINVIRSGGIVAIFPEGRLERRRRKKNPKTGAVRLAIETKVPVLPIGIKFSFPFASAINIGKPIYFRNKRNIKKASKDLMRYVYHLRGN